MNVRKSNKHCIQRIPRPGMRCTRRKHLERDQIRQHPQLAYQHNSKTVVYFLAQPRPEDQLDDEQRISRHGQEICLEGVEPKRFNDERDIGN